MSTKIEVVKPSALKVKDIVILPDLADAEVTVCEVKDVDIEDNSFRVKGMVLDLYYEDVIRVTTDHHPLRVQLLKSM